MSKFVAKIQSKERVTGPDGDTWLYHTVMHHCDYVEVVKAPNNQFVTGRLNDGAQVFQEDVVDAESQPINNTGPTPRVTTAVIIENAAGKTTDVIRQPRIVS